jgi:hypothetical protein
MEYRYRSVEGFDEIKQEHIFLICKSYLSLQVRKEHKAMTQIILQVDDASIIPALKKTLKLLKGVKVKTITDIPNPVTIKAIKDAKDGKVIHSKNSTDMFMSLNK